MSAMRLNMRWDGYFHLAMLLLTILGVLMLWRDSHRLESTPWLSAFIGQMLLGWGTFNLVEGVIDHHILELHHVRDMPSHMPVYDWVFLGVGGVGMMLLGWALSRTRKASVIKIQYREAA